MQHKSFTYLLRIQYLGYRYHGWQKQPGVKTIQGMLERSIKGILGHFDFNILGAGRTDAGVSCQNGAFELFTVEPIATTARFQHLLNEYLPDDIRILSMQEVGLDFNVIQDVKEKEYRYYFSSGDKPHPFTAPFVVVDPRLVHFELMKQGAKCFEGRHDFRRYCTKPKPDTQFEREIAFCEVTEVHTGVVWRGDGPSYQFSVKGKGFLRNQVRLMMGALMALGRGDIGLEDLKSSLQSQDITPFCKKAPARGLVLQEVIFNNRHGE